MFTDVMAAVADYGFDQWLWSHGMTKEDFHREVRGRVALKTLLVTEVRTWEVRVSDGFFSQDEYDDIALTVAEDDRPDTVSVDWELV